MMKKIACILYLMAGLLFVASCEDDYREPTVIVNNYIKEYRDILTSEGCCWRFDYYPDATQYGAFNFLMEFSEDGRVKMQTDKNFFYLFASDEDAEKAYEPQWSDYTIQNSQGPVLTFATYSLLSKLADPSFVDHNFGSGWTGDNEFVLMRVSEEKDTIYLKSVRAQKQCFLVKETLGMEAYIDGLNQVVDEFVGSNVPNSYFRDMEFAGQEEASAVLVGFDMVTRSGVVYQSVNDSMVADTCVVCFTPEGIHLLKPLVVNGVEVNKFVYDGDRGEFLINGEIGSVIKMAENGRPKFRFSTRRQVFRGQYPYVSGRDTIMREDNYQLAYNPKSAEDEWAKLYNQLENYVMMAMWANDTIGSSYTFALYDQYQNKSGRTVPVIAQCNMNIRWMSDSEDEDMVMFAGAGVSSLLYASQNEQYVYEQGTELAKTFESKVAAPLKDYLEALFGNNRNRIRCVVVPAPDYESFSFVNVVDGSELVIFKY